MRSTSKSGIWLRVFCIYFATSKDRRPCRVVPSIIATRIILRVCVIIFFMVLGGVGAMDQIIFECWRYLQVSLFFSTSLIVSIEGMSAIMEGVIWVDLSAKRILS